MPRVRPNGPNAASTNLASPMKSVRVPLNDDKAEKAQRLQSRQALHSQQMSQIKAAATPQRKRRSLGGNGPLTPSQQDGDDDDPYGVRGDHVTPMKRVPILANFEEWMKMATDNKINAANSWNFALIDYFHDMTLLKEGNQVNFQKASCTLDGCVKIYTSRVDSVATETGKLLSGLADNSGGKKRKGGEAEEGADEEGEEEEEGEDGVKKKGRKKAQRSAEATLVGSFEQLRLKKMELEFAVDPLFKKASADFDEGGAKGLLLNHLSIDSTGRIVFDSSDDVEDEANDTSRRDSMEPDGDAEEKKPPVSAEEDGPVDIAALGARFFPDLSALDEQDVCPSLKTFELGAGDGSLDLPFPKAPENWRDEHPESDTEAHQPNPTGNDFNDHDDDAGAGADFDLPPDTGFGEGGEAWARDAALHPQLRVFNASTDPAEGGAPGGGDDEVGVFDTAANTYGVTLQHRPELVDQENILNYFDNALQKNWAGPEHWKITRIKEANKPATAPRARKEKEPFEIDFAAPMTRELAGLLYTPASGNAQITLPRKDWRSKTRNLLPDDKHFNSKDLLKLFLKPKARLGARKGASKPSALFPAEGREVDEAYWASHNAAAAARPTTSSDHDASGIQGDYDANFFQDDGLPLAGGGGGFNEPNDDDDDFADAREVFAPLADDVDAAIGPGRSDAANPEAFGANLIAQSRRMRPEYVQYARVAKKVDVRRLKEEMWRGMGLGSLPPSTPSHPSSSHQPASPLDATEPLMFTTIMNNLQHVYPKQQLADISTSYGFICLLHLANEKGLVIGNVEGWGDLSVRRDATAEVEEGDL